MKTNHSIILAILIGLFAMYQLTLKYQINRYEIADVHLSYRTFEKDHLKSISQFIATTYADIFGENISPNKLRNYKDVLEAGGDKQLLEKLFIQNILNSNELKIPSEEVMRHDIPLFIEQTYLKLFKRKPDPMELFTLNEYITADTSLSTKGIYFALMTSNEYRKF